MLPAMDDSAPVAVGASSEAPDPPAQPTRSERRRVRRRRALQVAFALSVFAAVIVIQVNEASGDLVTRFIDRGGYAGVFVASILSGFNLAIPVPVIAFFPSMIEAGLRPVITVALISLGMTVGDAIGCMIGVYGRRAIQLPKNRISAWIDRTRHSRPWLVWAALSLYAGFVPLPNEVFVVPLAFFGFRPTAVVGSVLAGNIVFNSLAAYGILEFAAS